MRLGVDGISKCGAVAVLLLFVSLMAACSNDNGERTATPVSSSDSAALGPSGDDNAITETVPEAGPGAGDGWMPIDVNGRWVGVLRSVPLDEEDSLSEMMLEMYDRSMLTDQLTLAAGDEHAALTDGQTALVLGPFADEEVVADQCARVLSQGLSDACTAAELDQPILLD